MLGPLLFIFKYINKINKTVLLVFTQRQLGVNFYELLIIAKTYILFNNHRNIPTNKYDDDLQSHADSESLVNRRRIFNRCLQSCLLRSDRMDRILHLPD